jgi:hypothetical protein
MRKIVLKKYTWFSLLFLSSGVLGWACNNCTENQC